MTVNVFDVAFMKFIKLQLHSILLICLIFQEILKRNIKNG